MLDPHGQQRPAGALLDCRQLAKVLFKTDEAVLLDSRIECVEGDEAGSSGGVTSGVPREPATDPFGDGTTAGWRTTDHGSPGPNFEKIEDGERSRVMTRTA